MLPTVNVLGVGISAVNMDTAVQTIDQWIEQRDKQYVCVRDVNGVMESQRSPELRRIHNEAGMVTPDGMPLLWALRAAGHKTADRVCGPELMPTVFQHSQKKRWRHFLYGTTEETLRELRAALAACAPEAAIVGCHAPPFRPRVQQEDKKIVDYINECRPDIVWVGLSTPKQEYWMAQHRPLLDAPVLIGVGGAFDMTAGRVKRAPAFLRRTGFEWTYRLLKEPRRLWKRYLRNNPQFMMLYGLQKLGLLP